MAFSSAYESEGKWMFFSAYCSEQRPSSRMRYSGRVSVTSCRQRASAADSSLHITLPVMPPFLSFSVLG